MYIQVHKINKNAFGNGESCYLIASTHPLPGNPFSFLEVNCEYPDVIYMFSNLKLASYLAKYTGMKSIHLGWYMEGDYVEAFK